ncbi:MAG TPA: hypothetical protein VFI16_02785 [Anaeromyxobacteraceae bacterium]|nr:hypothetical protein [Anaeromyxobacteraceae bacterium]
MSQIEVTERATAAALPAAPARAGEGLAEEQLAYARVLDGGMRLGLLALLVTSAVYLLGLAAPHVPVADLPRYWSLPVAKYLAAAGIPAGWGWVSMVHKGDFLNFVGIAFLSGITIACYLAIGPIFIRKRDTVYAWLSILEVLVLALAASGLLTVGAH